MFVSYFRVFAICAVAVLATGCAQLKAPPYGADYAALEQLKAAKPGSANVLKVEPTDPAAQVNNLSLRGTPLNSASGTFSKYLEEALVQDLKEISAYDPQSQTQIDAKILANDIDIRGFSMGSGVMEIELRVLRSGEQRLKKTYKAETSFESSFMGAVAIPAGQAAYPQLVRELLRKVYADPQFLAALAP